MEDTNKQRRFFGQYTTIANEIARNLDAYAENQILAELTQNADDARAQRVAFMIDARNHGTQQLLKHDGEDGRMAELQGPALLAYDSVIFKPEDFEGLRAFGLGAKRYDPTKTGQFGLGFNSVYHLTEVPQFVSGEHLVLLDPQYSYLPGLQRSHEPGLQVHLPSEDLNQIADQLTPFNIPVFNCDLRANNGCFNGTLFRLPFRTEAQAAKTTLRKSRMFSIDDMLRVFYEFQQQAAELLLFLHHVEVIELWIWEASAMQPTCTFKVESEGSNLQKRAEQVLWLRTALDQWSAKTGKPWKQSPQALTEIMESISNPDLKLPRYSVLHHIHIYENEQRISTTSYWLRHGVGYKKAWKHSINSDVKASSTFPLWPVGSVAACVAVKSYKPSNTTSISQPFKGRAFATLPTEIYTGYPVHVNARWCLMDNRQALQMSKSSSHKRMSTFNKLIIEDVLAALWAELLMEIKEANLKVQEFYALWPDENQLVEPWRCIVKPLYTIMAKKSCCVIHKPNGMLTPPEWRKPTEIEVDDISEGHLLHQSSNRRGVISQHWAWLLAIAKHIQLVRRVGIAIDWESCVFSTLAPLTRFKVLTRTLTYKLRLAGNVVRALISDGYPLSAVPRFIVENFKRASIPIKVTTPGSVSKFYQQVTLPSHRTPMENCPVPSLCNSINCAAIISYILDVQNGVQNYRLLSSTPLLAMADNTLLAFGKPCHPKFGNAILSASRHIGLLLGTCAQAIVAHEDVTNALFYHQANPLLQKYLHVTPLNADILNTLIYSLLPEYFNDCVSPIEWKEFTVSSGDEYAFLSREWIEAFFAVLAVMVKKNLEADNILTKFENIPVIAACKHCYQETVEYMPPKEFLLTFAVAKNCVLRYPRSQETNKIYLSDKTSKLCSIVSCLGVYFLLEDFIDNNTLVIPFKSLTPSALVGVLATLRVQQLPPEENQREAGCQHEFEQAADTFASLSSAEANCILQYLEYHVDELSDQDLESLKTLPLFEVESLIPTPVTEQFNTGKSLEDVTSYHLQKDQDTDYEEAALSFRKGVESTRNQKTVSCIASDKGDFSTTASLGHNTSAFRNSQLISIDHMTAPRELPEMTWSPFLSDAQLLKSKTYIAPRLYQRLGVTPLTEAEYFIFFVFPRFPSLKQSLRLEIIKSICNHGSLLENEAILRGIRDLAFVPVANGDIVKPVEAYSSSPLFIQLFPDKVISLTEEDAPWLLAFLMRVGITHTVSSKILLDGARLAAERQQPSLTDALLSFLGYYEISFGDREELFQNLSHIPFLYLEVPKDPIMQSMLPYDCNKWFKSSEVFIPSSKAESQLVWSQVPTVSDQNASICIQLPNRKPTPELVAKHLEFCSNLSESLLLKFSNWRKHRFVDYLVAPCYSKLSDWLNRGESAKVYQALQNGKHALILNRRFGINGSNSYTITPEFVDAKAVFDCVPSSGIPPFAYSTSSLANCLLSEDALLHAMGIRASPTLEELLKWLAGYGTRFQNTALEDDMIKNVTTIFTLLERYHVATIRQKQIVVNEYFYVLTHEQRLVPAKHAVVDDAPWLNKRIDMSAITQVSHRIAGVAKDMGVLTLEQVRYILTKISAVQEQLHPDFLPNNHRCHNDDTNTICKTWQITLRSRQFRKAVLRIALHDLHGNRFSDANMFGINVTDDYSEFPEVPLLCKAGSAFHNEQQSALREKLVRLQHVNVIPVTELRSQFIFRPTNTDITKTSKGSPCLFIDDETGPVFYLDTTVPRFRRLSALVMTLNRFFDSAIYSLQALEKVIESSPSQVETTLDFLHISQATMPCDNDYILGREEVERLTRLAPHELADVRPGQEVVVQTVESGREIYELCTVLDMCSDGIYVTVEDTRGISKKLHSSKLFRLLDGNEYTAVLREKATRMRQNENGNSDPDVRGTQSDSTQTTQQLDAHIANIIGEDFEETEEQAIRTIHTAYKTVLEKPSVARIKYEPVDPEWQEKEVVAIQSLKVNNERLRNELEPEEPGVDEVFILKGISSPEPQEDLRLQESTMEVSTRVRRGYDLVRVTNIEGVAIFHSRDNIAPGRFQLFEQCVDVLKEVSAVFDYDGRYVALFHQESALSRFIKQQLLYNIWPIEKHALEKGVHDIRSDPFAYLYFYGLHIHKLAHFHDIVHGTRHDFYMNELRIEFLEEWISLLERKGFDPEYLETSTMGRQLLHHVVF